MRRSVCGSLSLLLLLLAVARATPGAVLPKAAGQPPYPLDLKLSVTRSGDKAVGNATITNTLNQTASVPLLRFDIRFTDSTTKSHKDDIRQQFNLPSCGSTKLPAELAPGAKLICPFTSADNKYKGQISVVAMVNNPADGPATGRHIAFDVAQV